MTVTANNNTGGNKSATTGSRRRSVLVFIPLIVFLGLAALFLIRLGAGDISRIPSVLIGHPAPATVLPGVAGLESSASTTRTRPRTRAASSPAMAIPTSPMAPTSTAAPRSNGVSMACPRPSWSGVTAASPTS